MFTESLDRLNRLTKSVKAWPSRKGKTNLLDHLSGKPLTRAQAITAMCYSCTAGDGGICTVLGCPLYPFSQYRTTGE